MRVDVLDEGEERMFGVTTNAGKLQAKLPDNALYLVAPPTPIGTPKNTLKMTVHGGGNFQLGLGLGLGDDGTWRP